MDEDLFARAIAMFAAAITAGARVNPKGTLAGDSQAAMAVAEEYLDWIDQFKDGDADEPGEFKFTMERK